MLKNFLVQELCLIMVSNIRKQGTINHTEKHVMAFICVLIVN